MKKKFRSNGKLMITGEYFVLDGALSLALPTIKGQSLRVYHQDDLSTLKWRSFDEKNKVWFEADFGLNFDFMISSNKSTASRLRDILKHCQILNPDFNPFGSQVETYLEFPLNWGLGSSSTLINNLAQWALVNPFELLWKSFGGSGYDIACASIDYPILYSLKSKIPQIEKVSFDPPFRNRLYFLHLNKKQNSHEAIQYYRTLNLSKQLTIQSLNQITRALLAVKDIDDFERLVKEHERIISENLKITTVKNRLFPDYQGAIKSLGAWGGDFLLVTYSDGMQDYFRSKGYHTIIPYRRMILPADL